MSQAPSSPVHKHDAPPPAPSLPQFPSVHSNQLTLEADRPDLQLPDVSWLEEETKEGRRRQWSRRLLIFIIHLNIFLIFYTTAALLCFRTRGIYYATVPIMLKSATFSWWCEAYRFSVILVVSWLIFMLSYWIIILILGILKFFLARRLGTTTMGDILMQEAYQMELYIHYTLVSLISYFVANTIVTVAHFDGISTASASTEKFNLKEILLNLKGHFFTFEYPATIVNTIAYNAFFSTLLLIERIFLRKFAINFHFNYFQDRIQVNTFLIGTLDVLRNQLKKLKRESALKGQKKGLFAWSLPSRHQLSLTDVPKPPSTEEKRRFSGYSTDAQQGTVHKKLAAAIFTVLNSFRNKNNLIEEDLQGLLPAQNASKFFAHLAAFSGGTEEITKQQFVEFVDDIYREKENLLHSVNDQKDLIRQLDHCMVLFVVVITIMFCLPKLLLVVFPVAYLFDNVLQEDLEDTIDAGIFVFIKHPFDVGDSILLDGTKYRIISIDFMLTTMLGPTSNTIYVRNCELNRKIIHNIKRAGYCLEDFCFSIDPDVEMEKLDLLQTKAVAFINRHPQDYRDYFKMWGYELINSHRLDIYMTIEFACSRHVGEIYNEKKNLFLLEIKRLLFQLEIPITVNQFS